MFYSSYRMLSRPQTWKTSGLLPLPFLAPPVMVSKKAERGGCNGWGLADAALAIISAAPCPGQSSIISVAEAGPVSRKIENRHQKVIQRYRWMTSAQQWRSKQLDACEVDNIGQKVSILYKIMNTQTYLRRG